MPSVGVKPQHGSHVAQTGGIIEMLLYLFIYLFIPTGPLAFHMHFVVSAYYFFSCKQWGKSARLQAGAHQCREGSDGGAAVVMETPVGGEGRDGWSIGKWDQFVLLLKVTWHEEAPPASPRYHGFNRLELLLRSVTTKWLQRLRRRREPIERFMVGLI